MKRMKLASAEPKERATEPTVTRPRATAITLAPTLTSRTPRLAVSSSSRVRRITKVRSKQHSCTETKTMIMIMKKKKMRMRKVVLPSKPILEPFADSNVVN